MTYEYDRQWRRLEVTEQEDAEWERLLEQQERADEHASRWAGAETERRNGASPVRSHDGGRQPAVPPSAQTITRRVT